MPTDCPPHSAMSKDSGGQSRQSVVESRSTSDHVTMCTSLVLYRA